MQRPLTILLAFVLFACGATARERTLQATLVTVNAARDGFVAYDGAKQRSIVDAATTLEAGRAELAAYRKRREPVIEAFTAVYRAVAIAAVVNDDPKSLVNALDAARRLAELLADFGCNLCKAVSR